jgi:uncharacterized protein (TIGR02265 family)
VQDVEAEATGRALELVGAHCDLAERLKVVPPSARVRGMYFNTFRGVLRGAGQLETFGTYFPHDRHSSIRFYPLRDYMVRLAVSGALLASPSDVHLGMHEIWRAHALSFASSLLGKAMLRLLSNDPVRVTEQGLAARRQTFQYGHWSIQRLDARALKMVYEEEYIWIESAIAGGAVGAFESAGVKIVTETELVDRFNGSTLIRW